MTPTIPSGVQANSKSHERFAAEISLDQQLILLAAMCDYAASILTEQGQDHVGRALVIGVDNVIEQFQNLMDTVRNLP